MPGRRVKKEGGLSACEKSFCLSYIQNFNACQAAINAGVLPKEAKEVGYELLQREEVKKEIERLKEIKRGGFFVSEDDVLERHMQIAFADITDYVEFGTEEVSVVDKKTNEVHTRTVNNVYLKSSKDVNGGVIAEVWRTTDGAARIKLADRQRSLEWLAKYFNMNPLDKHKAEYEKMRLRMAEREKGGLPEEIRFVSMDGYDGEEEELGEPTQDLDEEFEEEGFENGFY